MSEKQKRGQHDNIAAQEQVVNPTTSHEVPADQPQTREQEKKDRDLENLNEAASQRAKIVAAALVSRDKLSYYPSELAKYEEDLTEDLKQVIKKAYESGNPDTVDVEMGKLIDRVTERNKKTKAHQERVQRDLSVKARINELKAERNLLEKLKAAGESLSEAEQQALANGQAQLNKLEKEHSLVTKVSKERWKTLSPEDQKSIVYDLLESYKDISNNKNLTEVERAAARYNLQKQLAQEWGAEMALEIGSISRGLEFDEKSVSTADVKEVKKEEEENPVRARGMKRFFASVTGKAKDAKNKVAMAWTTSAGMPVHFVAQVLKRQNKSHEGVDPKRFRTVKILGGAAVGAGILYAGYRFGSEIDFEGLRSSDLNLFEGGDTIDSSPDISQGNLNSGEGPGEVPGNNKWPSEQRYNEPGAPSDNLNSSVEGAGDVPRETWASVDAEPSWIDHNYFEHGWSLENSPFSAEGKNGANDYGPPLELGESFNDNLMDRIDSEPAMHRDYIREYNLEGSELSDAEIRDRLMNDREYFESTLEDIRYRLEQSESEIITLDAGTYGSTYHYENGGIVESAYDNSVDSEGATAVRKRFVDENGIEHITTIKSECGGQLIFEHEPFSHHTAPVEYVETPGVTYTPPVAYTEQINPIGGGEPPMPVITELPPEDVPTPELPPVEEPPVDLPPEDVPTPDLPPVEEPPVDLPPEDEPTPTDIPKNLDPEGWVVPDEIPSAENNEPVESPSQEIRTDENILDYNLENSDVTAGVVGTETDVRTDVIDSGASQKEIADLDLNTDYDSADKQAAEGSNAPTADNAGQKVQL